MGYNFHFVGLPQIKFLPIGNCVPTPVAVRSSSSKVPILAATGPISNCVPTLQLSFHQPVARQYWRPLRPPTNLTASDKTTY